jgi:molybdate transport system regulatory protein
MQPRLHIRIRQGKTILMGPGKAELLLAIQACGSISAAAKQMKMSYKRAWQLVDVMNTSFKSALVSSVAGGQHGGGAQLTSLGEAVLAHYQKLQTKANEATELELQFIRDNLAQLKLNQ